MGQFPAPIRLKPFQSGFVHVLRGYSAFGEFADSFNERRIHAMHAVLIPLESTCAIASKFSRTLRQREFLRPSPLFKVHILFMAFIAMFCQAVL